MLVPLQQDMALEHLDAVVLYTTQGHLVVHSDSSSSPLHLATSSN